MCPSPRFRLSRVEIDVDLGAVNTSLTSIDAFCPWYLREDRRCEPDVYRRHDGACNNLKHPAWGAARTTFRRFLQADYGDGRSRVEVPHTSARHLHRFMITA